MTEQLDNHLDNFHNWAKKSIEESSADNYKTTVKGFYRNSNRDTPIQLTDNETRIEQVSEDIANHITSRSMKFSLKKYFNWLSLQATSVQKERTASFLKNKINKVPIEESKSDIENKVISAETLAQVTKEADQTDTELGLMLRMMYETGARFSGMNRLLWRDVHRQEFRGEQLEPHQVFISQDRSKGKVDGVVEISDQTLTQLQELENEREADPSQQVFYPEMKNQSTYQKAWRFFDNNWPEYSTHYFRHSRLTHLGLKMHEEENLDYPAIKERLRRYARHKQASTTEIYIEIVKDKLAQKNQDMEKYRSVSWSN
ncbi:MAG: tyrosine-type recombinase/integrase [Candidatus Nanohaloarchaea archaeon]